MAGRRDADLRDTIDLGELLLHAEEFRRTAIVLNGDERDMFRVRDGHTILPMSVLDAFACELYFKFLIAKTTGRNPPWKHNLVELFNLIPPDLQALIKFRWDNPKRSQAALRAAAGNRENFHTCLQQSATAFERLRYSYQYKMEALVWRGEDIMETTRNVIFEIFGEEFAASRLPLPPNAVNKDEANVVAASKFSKEHEHAETTITPVP